MDIGTPLQAIEYALLLDDGLEMKQFLSDWQHGDIECWLEYRRFITQPPASGDR